MFWHLEILSEVAVRKYNKAIEPFISRRLLKSRYRISVKLLRQRFAPFAAIDYGATLPLDEEIITYANFISNPLPIIQIHSYQRLISKYARVIKNRILVSTVHALFWLQHFH